MVGKVNDQVPAAAALCTVTVPDVVPLNKAEPVVPPAAPMVMLVGNTGAVANTTRPVPVSSEITPANSAEVVAANTLNLFAVYATVPPVPNATELESVPVNVKVFDEVKVLPSAMVRVALVAGAVTATLLIDVAVATPKTGVVSVGDVANTINPEPVSSETDDAAFALEMVVCSKPPVPVETNRFAVSVDSVTEPEKVAAPVTPRVPFIVVAPPMVRASVTFKSVKVEVTGLNVTT